MTSYSCIVLFFTTHRFQILSRLCWGWFWFVWLWFMNVVLVSAFINKRTRLLDKKLNLALVLMPCHPASFQSLCTSLGKFGTNIEFGPWSNFLLWRGHAIQTAKSQSFPLIHGQIEFFLWAIFEPLEGVERQCVKSFLLHYLGSA